MPKKTNTLIEKLTPTLIVAMQERTIKKKDVAKELNVSQTHLSRTLTATNYKRTPAPKFAARKKATIIYQARAENRKALADKVVSGQITAETASEVAGCSVRTIYRYLAKVS